MTQTLTISDVLPHSFYRIGETCRILQISKPTLYSRQFVRDEFGRIPGWEVLRLAGVDWRVESAKQPRGDVRKRIRSLV
jgi:hypothetical protein